MSLPSISQSLLLILLFLILPVSPLIMALSALLNEQRPPMTWVVGVLTVFVTLCLYLFSKPPFPKNAPPMTPESWPILGSLQFFTQRWDFYQRSMARSKSGNFSFYAGQWYVYVALCLRSFSCGFRNWPTVLLICVQACCRSSWRRLPKGLL